MSRNGSFKGIPGPASNWGPIKMFIWKLEWKSPLRVFFIYMYGCYKD